MSQPGLLLWRTGAPPVTELQARGVRVLEWDHWCAETAAWLRPNARARRSLDPPARKRLGELMACDAVAVLGVRLASIDDLRCLHETLLVPVLRAGVPLLVECSQEPEALDATGFVEPGFEHPHTLERMRRLCARARAGDVRFPPSSGAPPHRPLDEAQLLAARAPGGVVQVIAPAGSGKTTVLVERVRELLARGAEPESILCMTFNDAAAAELRARLAAAGAGRVAARTFHSIGHQIVRAHGLVDGRTLHAEGWTVAQWGRFGRQAAAQVGAPAPEPAELPHELAAGPSTHSSKLTARQFLKAISALTAAEREQVPSASRYDALCRDSPSANASPSYRLPRVIRSQQRSESSREGADHRKVFPHIAAGVRDADRSPIYAREP
jgi:hypothetical protein